MKSSLNKPMKAILMIGFMMIASLSGCIGDSKEDQTITDNGDDATETYQIDSLVVAYEVRDDYPDEAADQNPQRFADYLANKFTVKYIEFKKK